MDRRQPTGPGAFASISPITSPGRLTLFKKSSTMTDQETLAKFTRILRDLLLDDSIELTMETRREDVPNWDSFNYINFIVAVEIESFPNVGAIVRETTKMLA